MKLLRKSGGSHFFDRLRPLLRGHNLLIFKFPIEKPLCQSVLILKVIVKRIPAHMAGVADVIHAYFPKGVDAYQVLLMIEQRLSFNNRVSGRSKRACRLRLADGKPFWLPERL